MLQLSQSALVRVLGSLAAAEMRLGIIDSERLGADTLIAGPIAGPGDQAQSLGADSFQFVSLAGAVTRFFQLRDSGLEDYLLRYRTLGEWAQVVSAARQEGARNIAFSSSGSTGKPSVSVHDWESLAQEVHFFAEQLSPDPGCAPGRVIAATPSHHIYGFLFGVLLPTAMERPVLTGLKAIACAQAGQLQAGDIVVGVPFLWHQLVDQGVQIPPGVTGITSTGPIDPNVIAQLKIQGLARMLEIYGASQTGGIGYRFQTEEAFALLPRWHRAGADDQLLDQTQNRLFDLEDVVQWRGLRHLIPTGRKDKAVQVGGTNVYPQHIAQQLERQPGVARAVVRPEKPPQERLKAFIVPTEARADSSALQAQLRQWCARQLSPAETPHTFTFGPELPQSPMGKPQDWEQTAPDDYDPD